MKLNSSVHTYYQCILPARMYIHVLCEEIWSPNTRLIDIYSVYSTLIKHLTSELVIYLGKKHVYQLSLILILTFVMVSYVILEKNPIFHYICKLHNFFLMLQYVENSDIVNSLKMTSHAFHINVIFDEQHFHFLWCHICKDWKKPPQWVRMSLYVGCYALQHWCVMCGPI